MKILLPVKRVTDYSIRVYPDADGVAPDTAHTRKALNPFDEIAAEQALQLKESGVVTDIVAVTAGIADDVEALRAAAALGADKGIHIVTDAPLSSLNVAKLLAAVAKNEAPDMILMGKQNIDGDNNQTGQMLAALLQWSQITFCSELALEDGGAVCGRETDDGIVRVGTSFPAVITCDLRLNVPRRPALPQIMKARTAPIETTDPQALGVALSSVFTRTAAAEPAARKPGIRVASTDALYDALRAQGAV